MLLNPVVKTASRAGGGAAVASLWSAAILLAALAAACAESSEPAVVSGNEIEILGIDAPDPVLQGTRLVVSVRGLDPSQTGNALRIESQASGAMALLFEDSDADLPGVVAFKVTHDALQSLGVGTRTLSFALESGPRESEPFIDTLTLAQDLDIGLEAGLAGAYFRNDEPVLSGSGFVAGDEGRVEAEFVGQFTPGDGSDGVAVYTKLTVDMAEAVDRTRGTVRLTTGLGGIKPGTFEGTVALTSTLTNGHVSRSAERAVSLSFGSPALFDYGPTEPYLGQIVEIRGGGFLGAASNEATDEATVLRFEGELVLPDGTRQPFGPKEAVTVFVSGQRVQLGIDVEQRDGELVSGFFGVRKGVFEGVVTPIVIKGVDDDEGDPTPISVTLSGVQQVVLVRFLPGFFDSLRRFGLASAADQVVAAVFERMNTIYAEYNVMLVAEPPADFLPGSVATLEIGGPDPNGLGLFGYDNTPGKDVGNLRLHDSIGGTNAETQADNYPGYGGVFIESYLYWSKHPELDSAPPGGAPEQEPLFDEIFDPVRAQPATLDEATSDGSDARGGQVKRAIRALGSIIGETAAHELGHSLGLAQPHGPLDAFHSAFPGDGCLMDSGAFRELGERAREPGFPETHFCADEPEYLGLILSKDH